MFGLELQDIAELDVETAREQTRGRLKEISPRCPGQCLLAEVGDRFLLPRCRTELLVRAIRFLYPQPAESLGGQPGPLGKGFQARVAQPSNP